MTATIANGAPALETVGMLAHLTEHERREVLLLFARSLGFGQVEPDKSEFITWSLLNQDPESGQLPAANENPFFEKNPEVYSQKCETVVTAWLTLRDNALWARLRETLESTQTLTPAQQVCLIDVNRLARIRSRQECRAIQAYSRAWPSRSRAHLISTIASLANSTRVCDYMSTYKPRGLVPAPPFGLAAEIVVNTLKVAT